MQWNPRKLPKKNFQLLRKRIIEPAVKELTEKDGWLIEWEAVKSGRRVASLRFRFERNPQGGLFSQDVAPVPKQKAQTSAKKIICGKIRYEREGEAERLRRPSVVAVTANPSRSPSV